MKPIFADAFYFLALFNERDHAHQKARQFAPTPASPFLTTDWILVEFADACATMKSRPAAVEFIHRLQRSALFRIVHFSPELLERGLQLYGARQDKEWSLTDCVSFVVMNDEDILEALTGDRHFDQAGFTALLK